MDIREVECLWCGYGIDTVFFFVDLGVLELILYNQLTMNSELIRPIPSKG